MGTAYSICPRRRNLPRLDFATEAPNYNPRYHLPRTKTIVQCGECVAAVRVPVLDATSDSDSDHRHGVINAVRMYPNLSLTGLETRIIYRKGNNMSFRKATICRQAFSSRTDAGVHALLAQIGS